MILDQQILLIIMPADYFKHHHPSVNQYIKTLGIGTE